MMAETQLESVNSALRRILRQDIASASVAVGSGAEKVFPEEFAIVRNAVPKRLREFAAGRSAARAAMSALGAVASPLLSDHDRVPVWPEGHVGSISHSGAIAIAAVARTQTARALGVDIETNETISSEIATMVCRPGELRSRERWTHAIGFDAAKLVFCAKEAWYKAQFYLVRAFIDFQEAEIVEFDPMGRFVIAPIIGKQCQFWRAEGRFTTSPGYVLTSVVISPEA